MLAVKDNRLGNGNVFRDLFVGEVFCIISNSGNTKFFMKTHEIPDEDEPINAVCLTNGDFAYFDDNAKLCLCDEVELVING